MCVSRPRFGVYSLEWSKELFCCGVVKLDLYLPFLHPNTTDRRVRCSQRVVRFKPPNAISGCPSTARWSGVQRGLCLNVSDLFDGTQSVFDNSLLYRCQVSSSLPLFGVRPFYFTCLRFTPLFLLFDVLPSSQSLWR